MHMILAALASCALSVAKIFGNTASAIGLHQPTEPEELKKLMK